jgi:hypothetical protein
MPISGATCSCVAGISNSSNTSSQARIRVSTVSTSVPSRSKTSAAGA